MKLPLDESQLSLSSDGSNLLCPCLAVTLYLDVPTKEGLLDFYNKAIEALGSRLAYALVDEAERVSKITPKILTMVPTWIAKPRNYKNYFIVFGEHQRGTSAATIMMNFEVEAPMTPLRRERRRSNWRATYSGPRQVGMPLSELFISFPLDHPLAQPEALLAWINSLHVFNGEEIVSGQCGYAFNDYRDTGSSVETEMLQRRLGATVLQHPGFDLRENLAGKLLVWRPDADDLVPLIKRVNWLTFVGKRALEYLGGQEAVAAKLEPGSLHPKPWGAMIQASREPLIGDWGKREFVPAYRKVAAALRPVRLPSLDGFGLYFNDNAATDWLEAFDREY